MKTIFLHPLFALLLLVLLPRATHATQTMGMGDGSCGQLGTAYVGYPISTPRRMSFDAVFVSAGACHTMGIDKAGSLWAMGDNLSGQLGQLGNGSTFYRSDPIRTATNVASVSAGGSHTLFVKTDGSLWAMGYNFSGQLGDGSTTSRSTPVLVATGVASVSAGGDHTLFIKTDGTLWAMGMNSYGQLGDNSTSGRKTPVLVATGVSSVSAGYAHTLFVKTDGSLWSMGWNMFGQLGDGSTINRSVPGQIATGVVSVSAGAFHTLFVKTDGTLWAVGDNSSGQLGDGSSSSRSNPVKISMGVASASAGEGSSMFIKTNLTLWGMGSNDYGQLGDGSISSRATPVYISDHVSCVSAGYVHTLFIQNPLPLTPRFSGWAFGAGLSMPAADYTADPDGDGTPNLLEYLFGTSPTLADSNRAFAGPVAAVQDLTGQPTLVLTHRRRKVAAHLITIYESSSDFATWAPIAVTPVVTNSDADRDGLVELVTVSVPLPAGVDPRLFLRLSVTE